MKPRLFEVIIFDLDQTLVDETPNVRAGYRAAGQYAEACFRIDPDHFADLAPAAAQEAWSEPDWLDPLSDRYGLSAWDGLSEQFPGPHQDLDELHRWLPVFRDKAWRLAYARFGVDPPLHIVTETARAFSWARHRGRVLLAKGVADMLASLGDRDLGIITNGPADGQERKVHRSGLGRIVKAVVTSTAAGVGKPEPRLITHCLSAMGHDRERRVLIVGDSLKHDIEMAVNDERPAIWIRAGGPSSQVPAGVVAVDNATEITRVISEMEA